MTDSLNPSRITGTISRIHKHIHDGNGVVAEHEFIDISAGSTRNVYISVPEGTELNVRAHSWTPSSHSLRMSVYRNPTIDTAGSSFDIVENPKDGGPDPETSFEQQVTTTDDGTKIRLGGSSGTRETASVNADVGEEIILKEATDYLFVAENLSTTDTINYLWFDLFGYEE